MYAPFVLPFSLVDFSQNCRIQLEIPIDIHQAVDFLLYIRYLGIAVAADIGQRLYGRGNGIITADKEGNLYHSICLLHFSLSVFLRQIL